ncbi:MAG: glycosyltransferase [Pseudomonadota bacterium]
MTPALLHIVSNRVDLAEVFDVGTESGLWHAIAWFYVHGLREYGLAEFVDLRILSALDAPPPFFEDPLNDEASHPPLTWLMFFVWRCSSELQRLFDLTSRTGRNEYTEWFLFEGVHNCDLAILVSPRWKQWLREPLRSASNAPLSGVKRVGCLQWLRRKDLQNAFKLDNEASWSAFSAWTENACETERALAWLKPAEPPLASIDALPPRPFGVNLIGFAFGELGIGEDVRMAAAACGAADIPFSIVNIDPGKHLRQADRSLERQLLAQTVEAPYSVNLFCLTGFDTARMALERGPELFEGRTNIGWWPWELPVWPKAWLSVLNLVDEVWAATRFTLEMYVAAAKAANRHAPTPVTHMPLPASVSRVKDISRSELGLPDRTCLFLYIFDFNSYLERKNPFSALHAFRNAFPLDDDAVGLVFKTMNSNPKNPAWKRFLRECKRDARITVLEGTMERGEVLALIRTCDVYVSLHRSEGFGRTLAEAMLFGKPVVGTNFSGNVDFLTENTGFPVQYAPTMVQPGEYPFVDMTDGAWWADVDIPAAAAKLGEARAATKVAHFGKKVRAFSERQFDPKRIGLLMKKRLIEIEQR